MQVEAGAKAVCICEPAANKVYISPNQLEEGSDVFDRYVINYNKKIRQTLGDLGADLIFHDCGELIDVMVSKFSSLDPAVMSLGSSRKLWEDAKLVSKKHSSFWQSSDEKVFLRQGYKQRPGGGAFKADSPKYGCGGASVHTGALSATC